MKPEGIVILHNSISVCCSEIHPLFTDPNDQLKITNTEKINAAKSMLKHVKAINAILEKHPYLQRIANKEIGREYVREQLRAIGRTHKDITNKIKDAELDIVDDRKQVIGEALGSMEWFSFMADEIPLLYERQLSKYIQDKHYDSNIKHKNLYCYNEEFGREYTDLFKKVIYPKRYNLEKDYYNSSKKLFTINIAYAIWRIFQGVTDGYHYSAVSSIINIIFPDKDNPVTETAIRKTVEPYIQYYE